MDIAGVPFTLRKKFYPLAPFEFRKIQSPLDDVDSYEYDFTFERETLSSSETYHEEKDKREQLLAERRARLQEERKLAEEARKREEEERKRVDEEMERLIREEEEERLALTLTFPDSLAHHPPPPTPPSQNQFIPPLPPQLTWTPAYYHHHPHLIPVTAPPILHQNPLPWRDPSSHSNAPTASVASTPSFISTQFPFLSRFARANRYDN